MKYAALNSSRDITITTYIPLTPDESPLDTTETGSTKRLVEILESKSR